jgi:hypothetical protein
MTLTNGNLIEIVTLSRECGIFDKRDLLILGVSYEN